MQNIDEMNIFITCSMMENERSIYIRTSFLLSICYPKPFKRTQNYTKEHNKEIPKRQIKSTIFNNFQQLQIRPYIPGFTRNEGVAGSNPVISTTKVLDM
jgi:hypothetical protein